MYHRRELLFDRAGPPVRTKRKLTQSMSHNRYRLGILTLTLLTGCQGLPQKPLPARLNQQAAARPRNGYQVYFGNLHSHTSYSDGILNPREAYRTAEGNGLDFMAITEHNHAAAGGSDGIYLTPELYEDLKKTAAEFSVPGKFAALYGQEFSTISKGNHMNVFNASTVIDVASGDFKTLYEKWLPSHPEVKFIQFNHPNYEEDMGMGPGHAAEPPEDRRLEDLDHQNEAVLEARLSGQPIPRGSNNMFNDYGYDDYQRNFSALVRASAPWLRTIEILNGPGTSPKPIGKAQAYMEPDFLFYLNQGFKLAPTADQDNHYATWGSLHTGRTGVLATELTPAAIYEALQARRVFASEDQNLELVLQANGHFMGESFASAGPVECDISIQDRDEPDSGFLLQIYADQAGGETAKPIVQEQLPGGTHSFHYSWNPPPGESYAFVKVTQINADGRQDNAWTAPIWVTR